VALATGPTEEEEILTSPESLCVEMNDFVLYSTWFTEFLFGVSVTDIALLRFKKMGVKWVV